MRACSSWWRGRVPALLLLCAWSAGTAVAQGHAEPKLNPVVVELFTSEGCSSCPPVDRWVEQLDTTQPLSGAELIVLSEHVDYWDHDGWKDPYSSSALTDRQEEYVRALGLSGPYTPLVVLDGAAEVHSGDAHEVAEDFQKAAETARLPLQIEDVHVANGAVTGHVVVGTGGSEHGAVLVAAALDRTETDVLGGENNGRKLTNVAVVLTLTKIGKLEKGKGFDRTFRIPVAAGAAGNLRVVALVQEGGIGRVVGAGMVKVGTGVADGR